MKRKFGILIVGFCLLANVSPVFAENGKRFSQLEFDRLNAPPPKASGPESSTIAEILGTSDKSVAPVPDGANTGSASQSNARASLQPPVVTSVAVPSRGAENSASAKQTFAKNVAPKKPVAHGHSVKTKLEKFEWERHDDSPEHDLVPRLKGPINDDDSRVSITSPTWLKLDETCADLSDVKQVCRKAKALKEMLYRYSGTDDFFDSQCNQSCTTPGYDSRLSGFTVEGAKGGEFRIVEDEEAGECRYQIRNNGSNWLILEGKRGVCTCLPSGCV